MDAPSQPHPPHDRVLLHAELLRELRTAGFDLVSEAWARTSAPLVLGSGC